MYSTWNIPRWLHTPPVQIKSAHKGPCPNTWIKCRVKYAIHAILWISWSYSGVEHKKIGAGGISVAHFRRCIKYFFWYIFQFLRMKLMKLSENFVSKPQSLYEIEIFYVSATWPCLLTTLEDTSSRIFPASIRIRYAPTLFIDRSLLLLPENTRVCAVVATRRKIENQLSTTPTIRSPTFFTFNKLLSVGASLLAGPGHTLLLAAHVLVDDRGWPHEVLWTGHHKQVCEGWNVGM